MEKEQEDIRAQTRAFETGLLARVAAGDRDAFETLYARFQRPLYGYLTKMLKDRNIAEDLTNEVMLAVWRGAGGYQRRSQPSSWIFGIAHNKAVSYLRRRREAALGDGVAEALPDPGPTPLAAAERQDLARVMQGFIDQLSPEHQEVLQLTYYQELSIREIAEITGCVENTVKTRMHYARQRLKALLQAAGVEGVSP